MMDKKTREGEAASGNGEKASKPQGDPLSDTKPADVVEPAVVEVAGEKPPGTDVTTA
jgi:hypothetical protein